MTKLATQRRSAAATSLVLFLAVLAFPASGFAEEGGEGAPAGPAESATLALTPPPSGFPKTTAGTESGTQTIDVFNEGSAGTWIEKINVGGADSASFKLNGNDCGQIEPGQHCSIWITFAPGEAGERQAKLDLHLGDGADLSLPLSALAVPPHFSFQPGSHDFGLQPIHSESVRTTFQLVNDGEAAAQIGSLNFTGNSNGFWIGNSDCWGRWMQPGESCAVEVDFGPGEVGSYATEIQVDSYGQNFTAAVRGDGGRPIVEAFPSPADFGAATVGSTGAIQTIVIHNSGNVPTGFFIGIIAGGDAGSFQLLDEDCTGTPLMPAGSCVAHVRFTPQSTGPKVARLAFFGDSEGGAMVGLSGEGVAAAVTLLPSSYDFGAAAPGTKSAPQSFAVRNEGSTSLDLGSTALVGADLDQFSLSGEDCSGASLEPGGECVVRVRFAPDSAGAKTARLRVGGDAGTFTASLAGTGAGARAATAGAPSVAATGNPAESPRPSRRRGRHRRFARGAAVASARGRASRRGALRAGAVPR
jgi:hypothetical protein